MATVSASTAVSASDDGLVRDLAVEAARSGVAGARASELLLYDRSLRRRLGDRRLVAFLSAHPETFLLTVLPDGGHAVQVQPSYCADTPELPVAKKCDEVVATARCTHCGQWFGSRNGLFRHIRTEHSTAGSSLGSATAAAAAEEPRLAQDLVAACSRAVDRLGQRGSTPQLGWLVADPKVRNPLAMWLRSQQEAAPTANTPPHLLERHRPRSPMWWVVATIELHDFTQSRPATFRITIAPEAESEPTVAPEAESEPTLGDDGALDAHTAALSARAATLRRAHVAVAMMPIGVADTPCTATGDGGPVRCDLAAVRVADGGGGGGGAAEAEGEVTEPSEATSTAGGRTLMIEPEAVEMMHTYSWWGAAAPR
eukprot:4432030-Prymnesium_polylepis.1